MTDTRWERLAAAGGFISVVLSLAYIFLSPGVDALASASEVASVYAKNREGALFWNFIGTLSFFFFLFFLGALYNVLRRAEGGTGWLSLIAFSGGLAQIAIHSVETLAALYLTAAPDQKAAILQSYIILQGLFIAHFSTGALLWGIAFLLAASAAWSMAEFPRWLTILIALPGLVQVPKTIIEIVTGTDLGFLILLQIPLGIVTYFAVARVFWRGALAGVYHVTST